MNDRYRRCKACGDWHWQSEWPQNHVEPGPPLRLLSAPNVVRDSLPDLLHPQDNKRYDSKRAFRKTTTAYGGIETGSEPIKDRRWVDKPKAEDVYIAKQMVDQGYKPRPVTADKHDMNSIIPANTSP